MLMAYSVTNRSHYFIQLGLLDNIQCNELYMARFLPCITGPVGHPRIFWTVLDLPFTTRRVFLCLLDVAEQSTCS
jgi:hypothetical protein